jgi:hypothetical protein
MSRQTRILLLLFRQTLPISMLAALSTGDWQASAQTSNDSETRKVVESTPAVGIAPAPAPAGKEPSPWLKDRAVAPPEQPRPLAELGAGIEVSAKGETASLKGLTALRLHVANNTQRTLSFKGNEAVLALTGTQLKAAPLASISARIKEYDNPHGYRERAAMTAMTAAMTVGAWQAVRDDKVLRNPVTERYGFDNANRNQRLLRFGERVLWPGDSCEGVVYFESSQPVSLAGASLQVPVADFYNPSDRITLPANVK